MCIKIPWPSHKLSQGFFVERIVMKPSDSKRYRDKYLFGGNREKAIIRDGSKCVKCGITREQHKNKYGRDISVDHIDGKGKNHPKKEKNNNLNNLQTLCLKCHGSKDAPKRENHHLSKLTIESARKIRKEYKNGGIYQWQLAEKYEVSPAAIHQVVSGKYWREE